MINKKILIGNHKWLFSLNKASQSICYESRLSMFYSVSNIRAPFKRTHTKQLAMTFIKWANQFEVKPHFLLHQLSPGNKAYNHLLKPQSSMLCTKRGTSGESSSQKAKQLLHRTALPKLLHSLQTAQSHVFLLSGAEASQLGCLSRTQERPVLANCQEPDGNT